MERSSIGLHDYFLQKFYHNEVQQGYGGIGSYSLLSQYAFAAIPLDKIMTSSVLSPEELLTRSKINRSEFLNKVFIMTH